MYISCSARGFCASFSLGVGWLLLCATLCAARLKECTAVSSAQEIINEVFAQRLRAATGSAPDDAVCADGCDLRRLRLLALETCPGR